MVEQPAVRIAAAEALGRLNAQAALATLVRHRKDEDEKVRAVIEQALDAIAQEE